MVMAVGTPRALGVEGSPRLRFGEERKAQGQRAAGQWAGRRLLWLDERPAFELSYWCGTCPFLFRRLDGADRTVSLEALENRLAAGVDGLDGEVVTRFGGLLPAGDYVPLLLSVLPRQVYPVRPGDYFSEEQVATWGVDDFRGVPECPGTPYYRTFDTVVDGGAHLFEFVVPMVPPSWNDGERVQGHGERLRSSSRPTAVAVSVLDVCQPADDEDSRDYFAHWALQHFLLDGHHKMQAAAESRRPLRLLSLLSIGASLATAGEVGRVPGLRAGTCARRGEPT